MKPMPEMVPLPEMAPMPPVEEKNPFSGGIFAHPMKPMAPMHDLSTPSTGNPFAGGIFTHPMKPMTPMHDMSEPSSSNPFAGGIFAHPMKAMKPMNTKPIGAIQIKVPGQLAGNIDGAWYDPSSESTNIQNTIARDGQTLNLNRNGINGFGGAAPVHNYKNLVGTKNSVINFMI